MKEGERRPGLALAVLFVAALGLRFAVLAALARTPFLTTLVGDSVVYDAWADEIRRDVVGHDVFYSAPLYPYFLAAVYAVFGHGALVARVVQAILGAATCVLVATAGARLFSRRVGLLAGALVAVSGPCLFFGALVHKASLDLFLTAALLDVASRVVTGQGASRLRWAFVSGAVLGALALARENALLLFPLLGVAFVAVLERGARVRAVAAFVVGGAFVLMPVALRNRAVGGELVLTTSQFGANFYLGNHADADGTYVPLRPGHADVASEHADAVEIAERAAGHELTAREVSSYWSSRAWSWMRAHPGDWARLTARKWRLLWSAREIPDSDEILVYADASLVVRLGATLFGFGTFAALAAAGLVASWPARRRVAILYLVVGGLAAATVPFVIFGRYRVALYPPLALFAAAGVARMFELARERPPRVALAGLASLVVVAAVVTALPTGGPSNDVRRGTAFYNLAVTQDARGDLDEAVASYRRALALDPTAAQAHVNLGALLARGGAFAEAIAEETAALRLQPRDAIAHVDLANALLESGHLVEAEAHYRQALRLAPDQPDALAGLEALENARAGAR